MNDMTAARGIGDNNPPPFDPEVIAALRGPVDAFAATAGEWLDLGRIDTEEDAARLNDFLSGARKLSKEIDEARVKAKKPHDEAAKAVQAAFTPLTDIVAKCADRVKVMMTDFLRRQKEAEEAKRREAAAAAARAKAEAEEAARLAAMRNDVVSEAEAEAALKEAEKAEKAASREVKVGAGSATGGARTTGLRTYRFARVDRPALAFLTILNDPVAGPQIRNELERLGTGMIRASDWPKDADLPGFNIIEEERV
jgi:hypothetical protein